MGNTTFQYQVRDKTGKDRLGHHRGRVAGCGRAEAAPAWATPRSASRRHSAGMKTELKIPGFGGKVKLKDLAIMSRQFATMINSGLSLLRALNILSEQTPNKKLAEVLAQVRNDVETGQPAVRGAGRTPGHLPAADDQHGARRRGRRVPRRSAPADRRTTTKPRSSSRAKSRAR